MITSKFTTFLMVAVLLIANTVHSQCILRTGSYTENEVKNCLSGNKTLIIPDYELVALDGSWDLTSLGPITLIIQGTGGCLIFSGYGSNAEKLKLAEGSSISIPAGGNNPFALNGTGSDNQVRIKIGDTRYKEKDFEDLINGFGVSSVLPIELVYFKAYTKANLIQLDWKTEVEINNAFFEIMYSTNGKDFKTIAKIEGAGTSTMPIVYAFQHQNPVLGNNYYRLKQTDFDDTYDYTDLITVQWEEKGPSIVKIYPNPVQESFSIKTHDGEKPSQVQLLNWLGQVIPTHWSSQDERYALPASLNRGSYVLKMEIGGQPYSERLLIQ